LLKKYIPTSFNLAHISLAFVGLMWVLPFLNYHHAFPITTFYQEWGTALLGLCALPLLLTARYWQAPEVPRIVLLPIGLMMVLMVQFLVGRVTHFDHLLLLSLYFLFAALLMMLGQRLREELGLSLVVTVLATVLLAGAELNALAGFIQHYRWNTFLNSVITVKSSFQIYGNTAQPNHFANFIALGLLSLGLLHVKRKLCSWQTVLLAVPLLFVLVLSGSRSSWLYLTFALGLAWFWQRRDTALRSLWHFALALWLGFVVMHFVVQMPWLAGTTGSTTSAERLFGEAGTNSIRSHLWHEAMLIFAQFPFLGAGMGQFAYEHLRLGSELQNPVIEGLYNNAHNVVMQIAAEAGLAGLIVLLGAVGLWFWQSVVRKTQFDFEHWWAYGALAVIAIHSQLEYPLWYLHFIGIAAVLFGMFDKEGYRLELRTAGRLSVIVIVLLGAISLVQAFQGYKHLENALGLRVAAGKDPKFIPMARDELLATYRYPLLSSYGELFLANMMDPGAEHLADKLDLNQRALHYIPNATIAYHQALLLAWSDRPQEAREMIEDAIWAYPVEFSAFKVEFDQLVKQDAARFAPLLEFATQKYEEYQRAAVPGK
jgi:O-antigen ligase